MFIDLGAGAFDVTLMEYSENGIQVIATVGNNALGSRDLKIDF